jgi:O-antigen/teichoic acid export membrane protein
MGRITIIEADKQMETTQNAAIVEQEKRQDILTAAKGGGITFAGKLFEYVVRFAFGILIARTVGVEQYGLYTLGITVSLIASNMAMLGLQVGMVRFLPPAIREKDQKSIWGIIQICLGLPGFFSLFLAAGLFLLADPLNSLIFHDPRMVPILRLVSLMIPLDTLASMAYVITISYKQPKYAVFANSILTPLLKLMLAAGFLALGLSTKGILISQIIASVVGLAVLIYFVNTLFSLRRAFGSARQHIAPLLRYSLPVQLGWMITTLRSTFSTLVLGFLGLVTGVGVYTAASRFSMIGAMFYQSVGNISTPIIADLHSQHETLKMEAYYQTTTRWMVLFNLPIFLTSVIFAEPLLSIFGDDFTTGAASMIILAFGTLAYTGTGVGANILDMTDHPKVNTINSAIMVFVTIGLNVLFIPSLGIVGAAVASSISTILANVVCLIEVWAFIGIQPYNRSFFKPLLAGLIAALAAYLLKRSLDLSLLLQLLLEGAMLWAVYALILYSLKLEPEDKVVIERFFSRFRQKLPIARDAS